MVGIRLFGQESLINSELCLIPIFKVVHFKDFNVRIWSGGNTNIQATAHGNDKSMIRQVLLRKHFSSLCFYYVSNIPLTKEVTWPSPTSLGLNTFFPQHDEEGKIFGE